MDWIGQKNQIDAGKLAVRSAQWISFFFFVERAYFNV